MSAVWSECKPNSADKAPFRDAWSWPDAIHRATVRSILCRASIKASYSLGINFPLAPPLVTAAMGRGEALRTITSRTQS